MNCKNTKNVFKILGMAVLAFGTSWGSTPHNPLFPQKEDYTREFDAEYKNIRQQISNICERQDFSILSCSKLEQSVGSFEQMLSITYEYISADFKLFFKNPRQEHGLTVQSLINDLNGFVEGYKDSQEKVHGPVLNCLLQLQELSSIMKEHRASLQNPDPLGILKGCRTSLTTPYNDLSKQLVDWNKKFCSELECMNSYLQDFYEKSYTVRYCMIQEKTEAISAKQKH